MMDLTEVFSYDDLTGVLYWAIDSNKAKVGDIAGTKHNKGYLSVQYNERSYLVHRVIWYITYLEWVSYIDHIDGNRSNNKLDNLRKCTRSQNNYNSKVRKDNSSGHKGISWHKKINKFQARIQVEGKRIHLGYYEHIEDAVVAIKLEREKLHGKFTNHG